MALAVASLLAGCGGREEGAGGAANSATGLQEAGGSEGSSTAPAERVVISTAQLLVRVDDVEGSLLAVADAAAEYKGRVASQDADLVGSPSATVTVRVPAARLPELLDRLAALGDVRERDLDSTDVTEEVVDLEGRLATQQASATRLRELLGQAAATADIVAIEAELEKRETEIEALQGRLRVLDDRTNDATVTLRLTQEAGGPGVDDDLPSFLEGLRAGVVTFANVGLILLVVLGFVLPFVPLIALAWWARRWWVRRHPKRPEPPDRNGNPRWPLPPWPAGGPSGPPGTPPPPVPRREASVAPGAAVDGPDHDDTTVTSDGSDAGT